ncbi:MAG: undecaprenyl-diphosphate phosphatase [Salinivirgaceae bacterium]
MSWIEALVLGIIQGLTEFLPVSSSGHLEITKAIFGNSLVAKESMMVTVVLHAATALSTIVVFRKDIAEIIAGIFRWQWNEEMRFVAKIALSMVPAGVIGLLLEDQINMLFKNQIMLVGAMLIVTGLLLFIADKAKTRDKSVSFWDAILIGIAQAIAILPGISRAGATISTSVLLRIDRAKAARFSFLMVIPIILGKMLLDILSGEVSASTVNAVPLAVGFFAAFISGALACLWMIKLVKNAKLKYFAYYCFVVGLLAMGWQIWG